MNFQAFPMLVGGTGNDMFQFGSAGKSTGSIDGKAGANTLDYSICGKVASLNLATGAASLVAGSVANIESLVGSPAGTTLTAPNVTDLFQINGTNAGSLNGTFAFTGVQNLAGGTGTNTFAVYMGGQVSGTLYGVSSNSTLDYSLDSGAVSVNLQTHSGTGVAGINHISTFIGTGVAGATLIGANASNYWSLAGSNAGSVTGGITFMGFGSLQGGTASDTFHFASGASLAGTINGEGGGDTLDYTLESSGVTVNLTAGTATGTSGVSNILDVQGSKAGGNTLTGGPGGSILVGFGANNQVTGGAGRSNLLIGGTGADTLTSGGSGDILIGGSTSYDTNTAALAAILAEWDNTAAETYQQRINHITGAVSGGLNGSYDLNSSTVHHASSAVTLVGGTGTAFDWFFALQPRDTILHYQTGEQVS